MIVSDVIESLIYAEELVMAQATTESRLNNYFKISKAPFMVLFHFMIDNYRTDILFS